MLSKDDVFACLVTRGNVPMKPIIDSIPFGNILVYDNSKLEDMKVYGRYVLTDSLPPGTVTYVQDDDCILAPESFELLLEEYRPGVLTCNMPPEFRAHYTDSALVGFGAIFDANLPRIAFNQLCPVLDDSFLNDCDIVFTALTNRRLVSVEYDNLPYAYADDRMWKQSDHVGRRVQTLNRVRDFIKLHELEFSAVN